MKEFCLAIFTTLSAANGEVKMILGRDKLKAWLNSSGKCTEETVYEWFD
jgi:hypothetical protein